MALALLNFALEASWITATVVLILNGHPGWAVATFIAALISGYSSSTKTSIK